MFWFFFKHAVWYLKKNQNASSLKTLSGQTCFKENLNASRPSEHLPVKGKKEKMAKRLGGIIGCKYKTSSWQGSPMVVTLDQQYNHGEKPTVILYTYIAVEIAK